MAQNLKIKKFLNTPILEILNEEFCLWSSFFLLTAANTAFSYFSFSPSSDLWIALAGFGIPFLLLFVFLRTGKKQKNGFFDRETLSVFPFWLFILLIFLATGLRFYKLTTLSLWPLKDEGIFGYYAVRLGENWDWSPTQGLNHLPTLFTWIQGALFKLLNPSLFTLWVYPAFWSLLLLPAAWFAARQFFSRSMSLILLGFASFNFWPLWLGRFSTQAVFMVFWECLALGVLGLYLSSDPKTRNRRLILLSVITGIGFYTYLPWTSIFLVIGLSLFGRRSQTIRERLLSPLVFFFISLLIALPFFTAFNESRRGYLQHLWDARPDLRWHFHLDLYRSYLIDLFWGGSHSTFHYGPLWGGFLNPLMGGLFFLGLVFLFRSLPDQRSRWILYSIPVLLLPAFLTNDFEDMRLVQLIPLLAIITGLGFQVLISSIPQGKRLPRLFIIFSISLSLDGYHLFAVYPAHWPENYSFYDFHKSVKYFRAYPILKEKAAAEGPGLILQNFDPDFYDQTLFVATYADNAAENPQINPAVAKWFAVITNIHEQPFLKKIFPEGQWTWLSSGLNRRDGGFILEIVPITPKNTDLIDKWRQADLSLKRLNYLVMEEGVDPEQSQMLTVLDKAYPFFKGDRLLESRFWRIKALHHSATRNFKAALEDEKKAISLGYPMAQLYNEMGCLLYGEKRLDEARKAFEEALRMKLNCTDASVNLSNLNLLTGKQHGR